jgi:small-conductance mechanosensitive channel
MKRFFADMNPTLRGFLIIAAIVLVIVLLSLENTVVSLLALARIAFFIAIAFFIYLLWRERRSDIETWPGRSRFAFYGGALLIVLALGLFFFTTVSGRNALAFFLILGLSAFAMFRAWRDQHRYG